jgi:hypothetical protein
LSHSTSPFCDGFFRDRVHELFAQVDFELHSPDLCLLSSYDYRGEPSTPG